MKKKYKKLSFVIPVYNEEKTLEKIIQKIQKTNLEIEKEFILINDCSKDNTFKILEKYRKKRDFIILENEKNLGKSQTVKRGLIKTTGDLVVIQDADLEYEPKDLRKFISYFRENNVDLIYGNRFGKKNKVIYIQNWIGNTFLSLLSSLFSGLRSGMWTRDMEVCYKMAKGDIFRNVGKKIKSVSMFGLEPELTAKFSRYKIKNEPLKFKQIAIKYNPRTLGDGKKMNALKDGLKAFFEIIRFNVWE